MIVSIAVVAHNEERYLPKLLADIRAQDYPRKKTELLLIDSCSTDATRGLMERFQEDWREEFHDILVLDNPGKYLPQGCNVMLQHYTGAAVCRIDAHASIPADFVSENVKALAGGEAISGGPRPNRIDEETAWKRTLLIAEQSPFGSGAADYRRKRKQAYVDSVFHGMYKREVYETVGPYNEKLRYTEDNEMSWRIRSAGYKIFYTPSVRSYEYIRPNLRQMLKQKFRNGLWIGKTLKINPNCFSAFHLVPAVFTAAVLITAAIAFLGFFWLCAAMWGAYFLLAVAFTVLGSVREGFQVTNLALPGIFPAIHICYGTGTIIGLLRKIETGHRRTE